jgi:uncharacterized repeat protein (TIGR02543 family)
MKTKRKILAILALAIIILNNCVYAVVSKGTSDPLLKNVANVIKDTVYLDSDINAKSISTKEVELYAYSGGKYQKMTLAKNTTGEKLYYDINGNVVDSDSTSFKYSYRSQSGSSNYTVILDMYAEQLSSMTNLPYMIYKNALKMDNKMYDVKVEFTKVEYDNSKDTVVSVSIGKMAIADYTDEDKYNTDKCTIAIYPTLAVYATVSTQVSVKYTALDSNGNTVNLNGVFGITDLDLDQGVFIKNYTITGNNVYVKSNFTETITGNVKLQDDSGNEIDGTDIPANQVFYNQTRDGVYIYSEANNFENSNVYVVIDNQSSLEMTFTWKEKSAASALTFIDDQVNTYKKITTSVINGTITPSVDGKKIGESETISYAPNSSEKQYLGTVTVDGESVDISEYPSSYAFTNITENHTISVEYLNKYVVTFDLKGGTVDSLTSYYPQYVKPNEKATEPSDSPTKDGYVFGGWKEKDATSTFDFTTGITKDTTLEAIWTPKNYTISYVLDGGTNDENNPTSYTVEETKYFNNPTKTGYDFGGWYLDENFTTPITSTAGYAKDLTVYAKWTPSKSTAYKVEHYLEGTDGKYELKSTDELTAETGATVTAEKKEYTGYTENTTIADRVAEGTVEADGSLVLKLFYDKNQYTVTFDPQNGTTIPNQTVDYNEKATKPTEPTKDGYEFIAWYYTDENGKVVAYDFDDPVTKNIDLVAEWKKVDTVANTGTTNTTTPTTTTNTATELPNTGAQTFIYFAIVFVITMVGIVFGTKYRKLKKDIK